jgi:hypothetical protein
MKDTGFWDVMPCSANVSKKAAGCLVRVKEGYGGCRQFLSIYLASHRRREAYFIPEEIHFRL